MGLFFILFGFAFLFSFVGVVKSTVGPLPCLLMKGAPCQPQKSDHLCNLQFDFFWEPLPFKNENKNKNQKQ